jgi:hypothetical protein
MKTHMNEKGPHRMKKVQWYAIWHCHHRHREVREIRCCIGNAPLYDFEWSAIIAWAWHIETYAIYLR